jgi:Tfp pilus assembly protein PilO
MDTLERDKVVFVLRMRERLDQEKEALLKEGYSEQQLTKESVLQNAKEPIEKVRVTADRLGSQLPTNGIGLDPNPFGYGDIEA